MMKYKDLTGRIIGCAYRVHNKIGFGILESVYEKCLLVELNRAGLQVETQRSRAVYYDDKIVGEFVADMIVEDSIVLELKSVRRVVQAHEVKLVMWA